jgi:endoglucanase
MLRVAAEYNIPLQHEASSRWTGTDADDIFTSKTGVPTALISLPMRYMHSTVEMVDVDDIEKVIALMTAFVRSIQAKDSFMVVI